MPNLRGRKEQEKERSGSDPEAESDEEFDFGSTEEAEDEHGGNNQRNESEPAEQGGDEAKKGKKAKNKTWSDVVKGLKIEDKLETTNSYKSGNESETAGSVRMFDSETPNHLEAKQKKWQRKRRQHRGNKGAQKGCTSKQADQKGRGARARYEEPEGQTEHQVEIHAQHWVRKLVGRLGA